jgi:hypothetical protein
VITGSAFVAAVVVTRSRLVAAAGAGFAGPAPLRGGPLQRPDDESTLAARCHGVAARWMPCPVNIAVSCAVRFELTV